LREDTLRLIVVGYAYFMAVAGMFMVGAPYLLRDVIDWYFAKPFRGKLLLLLEALFGLALLGLGVFVY
jgi:ABC-type multidrug transport system fused ATPase/permease subunit